MIKRLLLIFLLTGFLARFPVLAEESTAPGRRMPLVPKVRKEIKANIKNFRDERKKVVIENVQKKLADLNERRTNHFTKVLERLTTILFKIQSRTEKAKAEGKNVSSIQTAIADARAAIATVESAVSVQKGKTYQITVNDEHTAKIEVGATVKQLHADLQVVHDLVQAARKAVEDVFGQIKMLYGN